jgi:hypothetical protein
VKVLKWVPAKSTVSVNPNTNLLVISNLKLGGERALWPVQQTSKHLTRLAAVSINRLLPYDH